SSRRRHTRCYRDWSSDVCSSDLVHIMVAHDQLLAAVQLSGNGEVSLAEAEVAQVPDRILLANDAIPAAHKLGVVFLDRGEWTKEIGRASCRERGFDSVTALELPH